MKKTLILLAGLSLLLSSCATVEQAARIADKSVDEVRHEHTPEEWAAFYAVSTTIAKKGRDIARTNTGKRLFETLAETAQHRAEQWETE